MAEQIHPESRAKDENGVPAPTKVQIEAQVILDARIARERAGYQGPIAGHDREMER